MDEFLTLYSKFTGELTLLQETLQKAEKLHSAIYAGLEK